MTNWTSNDYWAWRNKIEAFDTQDKVTQEALIDSVLNRNVGFYTDRDYYRDSMYLLPYVDDVVSLGLCKFCISVVGDHDINFLMKKLRERGLDSQSIKSLLLQKESSNAAKRYLLSFDNITEDEEKIGLYALAKKTKAPYFIHEKKYCPSFGALKLLPSVTRLNALETLMRQKNISFNIFKNIADMEAFKSLLFSSSMKYQKRVGAIFEKYTDIMLKGTLGVVTITTSCKECGDISVVIKSKTIHSKSSLNESRLYYLSRDRCLGCGQWLVGADKAKITIGE
ncbi:MAG: hypothetical protein WC523_05010 [Patescibacteria group bacterium]